MNGGELFTHLVQRVRFKEQEVALYSGEIVLALEHLHKVRLLGSSPQLQLASHRNIMIGGGSHGSIRKTGA